MHVMITGAAHGIGLELARLYAPEHQLSLVDINEDKLRHAASTLAGKPSLHAADLRDIDALPALVEVIEQECGEIDLLINNAGIMLVGSFSTMSWDDAKSVIDLDMVAPLRLAHLLAPKMQKRGGGGFINIASMAGVTPLPGVSFYCAAKAGIAMGSEIMRTELSKSGVHSLTVYPGPISTDLERNARAGLDNNLTARILPMGEAPDIAAEIKKAFEKKEARLIYPRGYALARYFPALTFFAAENFSPAPLT